MNPKDEHKNPTSMNLKDEDFDQNNEVALNIDSISDDQYSPRYEAYEMPEPTSEDLDNRNIVEMPEPAHYSLEVDTIPKATNQMNINDIALKISSPSNQKPRVNFEDPNSGIKMTRKYGGNNNVSLEVSSGTAPPENETNATLKLGPSTRDPKNETNASLKKQKTKASKESSVVLNLQKSKKSKASSKKSPSTKKLPRNKYPSSEYSQDDEIQ